MIFSTIRQVRQAVATLAAGAARLAAGEWERRIEVRSKDEMGRLAQTFNEMAEQLQALYGSLEQRVARRTADLKRRSLQLETAAQVARDASAIRSVEELLDVTVRLISERFGFYHVGMFVLDKAGQYAILRTVSSTGGQRMLDRGHKLPVGRTSIVGYVADLGQPRIAHDVGEDVVFFDNPDLPKTRSEMALPLMVRGRVIGVLDVQSTEPRAFPKDDVAILRTLADQIALAIENARLLEETQDRLQEISVLLGSSSREGWKQQATEQPGWGFTYDGVEVVPRDATAAVESEPQIAVPLQVHGESIGRLDLALGDRLSSDEEVSLAQAVAEQMSLALESARLYQETQRRAARERLTGEITARMRETLDVETVLETAAHEIGQALGLAALEVRLGLGREASGKPGAETRKGKERR
jgi:GAF domain-containing protein